MMLSSLRDQNGVAESLEKVLQALYPELIQPSFDGVEHLSAV